MTRTPLTELDIIYISYDEDNCEENWADLLKKAPWAKRVHGVKGFDSAHKEAARLSETPHFISVDGDNIVDDAFFDNVCDFESEELKGNVISWAAVNHINGLEYGNGGLKIWPVEIAKNMRTHENVPDAEKETGNAIEFCWGDNYVQKGEIFSTTVTNSSPLQAFRAGFREGVKMSLDHGGTKFYKTKDIKDYIWWGNYKRLIIWQSIGADVENGLWSIYGARLGTYMTNLTNWDHIQVRDLEYINDLFYNDVAPKFKGNGAKCYKTKYSWDPDKLKSGIYDLGVELKNELNFDIAEMDAEQSKFFKEAYVNPPRMG